ncbi:RNase H family protein [Streptomyces sp. NPDC050738]|uniref:ribonuclease HI n=1 Tax=Streptomyces sp. NPDC050738 TaxID=3154744 RepID=UPI0034497085
MTTAATPSAPSPTLTALAVAKRAGRRAWALTEAGGWHAETLCPPGLDHPRALLGAMEVLLGRPALVDRSRVTLLCNDSLLALTLTELAAQIPYVTVCAPQDVIGGSLLHSRAREAATRLVREATERRPALTAASDGSHAQHTRDGGWAWLAEDGAYGYGPAVCAEPLEAELIGIQELLRAVPRTHDLTVLCDSRAAIHLVGGLRPERPGGPWRTPSSRSARVHGTLLAIRQELTLRPPVTLRWVRGHDGHPLNEGADRLALHARRTAGAGVPPATARATAAAIAAEAVAQWQESAA